MPLRIFVTTDNHVGFNELDPVRGNDAAATFSEAMDIASASNVDLILQAGDLFHVNKPSKRSMYHVMKTLRKTCFNDNPVEFEVVNHGQLALDSEFDHVNYEDSNLNVGLPFFAISGNHDDAGGSESSEGMLSPLDILSVSGLINHFGRIRDNVKIVVQPILIEKNGVKVALYGMANVRDERLYRTFVSGNVQFLRPKTDPDQWFSILCVHQNHTPFGPKNYLPEQFLPGFLDLVIWGHEHECKIDPVFNESKQFLVVQPGSSVATSLSASELGAKFVTIVNIDENKQATFEKHMLKTVRPFILRTVSLESDAVDIKPFKSDTRAKVTEFLISQVEEMLLEAEAEWESTRPDQPKMLPLIRLRVDYTGGYEMENITRFSNRFVNRVANTNDVIHLIKRRNRLKESIDLKAPTTQFHETSTEASSKLVPLLMKQELSGEQMEILKPAGMVEALQRYVEKDEKQAIKTKVDDFVREHAQLLEKDLHQLSLAEPVSSNLHDSMWEEATAAKRKSTIVDPPAKKTKSSRTKSSRTKSNKIEEEEPLFLDDEDDPMFSD